MNFNRFIRYRYYNLFKANYKNNKRYNFSWSISGVTTVKKIEINFKRWAGMLVLLCGCTSVMAEQGDWFVRARGIVIYPNDDSGLISLDGSSVPNTGVNVDTNVVPELDVTYMFLRNWGVELIAGTSIHTVNSEGTGLKLPKGYDLFDTWVLPPTVTLQYHFLPDGKIRPYLGVGANYTKFFAANATSALESRLGGPVGVNLDSSWGWAVQGGVDISLKDNWFINLDLKYIDMSTTAYLKTPVGNLSVDVDVDPFVFGAGVGYRF